MIGLSLDEYCKRHGHGEHIVGMGVEFVDDDYAEIFGRFGTIYSYQYECGKHYYGFCSDETGKEEYGFYAYRFNIVSIPSEVPDVDADALIDML